MTKTSADWWGFWPLFRRSLEGGAGVIAVLLADPHFVREPHFDSLYASMLTADSL